MKDPWLSCQSLFISQVCSLHHLASVTAATSGPQGIKSTLTASLADILQGSFTFCCMKCETAIAVSQSTFSTKGGFHLPTQIDGVGGERDKTIRVLSVFLLC